MSLNSSKISRFLDTAFSRSKLQMLAEKVSAMAFHKIQDRTSRGIFLGGDLAKKGYSTNPIYAWKLGKTTYLGKGKGKRSNAVVLSVKREDAKAVRFSRNEIRWGKKGPVVLGGYKAFREKTGREASKVILTFSGRMLNSLQYRILGLRNAFRIVFGFNPSQDLKGYYTNRRRQFLGLSDPELKDISDTIGSEIDSNLQ